MYLDIYQTVSHNCLFNFLLGNRGGGKTYGFKWYAIDQYLKHGHEFAYVRRYKTDLKGEGNNSIATFFDDIRERYPEQKLEVKGLNFHINDRIAGKAFPLSTAASRKSVAYPKIMNIGNDEFLLDPSGSQHYLNNEPEKFLELYSTIARFRPNVRAFFMANAISISNPWFSKFNLVMPYNTLIYKRQNKDLSAQGLVNGVLMQLVQDPEFIEIGKQTALYDIIKDTKYAEYAIDNKFLLDNKNFVAKKTSHSDHLFSITYNSNLYGIWVDYANGIIYCSDSVDPYCPAVYAVTAEDHRPNTMLLKRCRSIQHIKILMDNYQLGNVRFESIKIKNAFQEIMKMFF